MRLTHSLTMYAEHRDVLAVEFDPESSLPISLSRDPEGEDHKVYLSYEQYDVIADLIWAHRPDSAIKDAEITGEDPGLCVFKWNTGVGEKRCALSSGHETYPDWTHVSAEGWTYKAHPASPAPF